MKPFLKWAGSKRHLAPVILERFPSIWSTYYEPMVGSGAVFFEQFKVLHRSYVLSDVNEEIINAFRVVRGDVEALIEELKTKVYERGAYERERAKDVLGLTLVERAARMIYLNRTCFNGLWRVNKQGKFNVPFGRYENPTICDEQVLLAASERLKGVTLACADFEVATNVILLDREEAKRSIVYFDPPYVPLSKSSSFTSYAKDGFGLEEQKRLRDAAKKLAEAGAFVLLSNSSSPIVYDLYADGFTITEVDVPRCISCKGQGRSSVKELLIEAKR